MKFTIPEVKSYQPVTEQQFYDAMSSWMEQHMDRPEFCLMHPATERGFCEEVMKGKWPPSYTKLGYTTTRMNEYHGVKIIRSTDIPEGEFHLCGK